MHTLLRTFRIIRYPNAEILYNTSVKSLPSM